MIVTMGESVPGREIATILGTVKGNTVRTRFFGRDIMAALRNLVAAMTSTPPGALAGWLLPNHCHHRYYFPACLVEPSNFQAVLHPLQQRRQQAG